MSNTKPDEWGPLMQARNAIDKMIYDEDERTGMLAKREAFGKFMEHQVRTSRPPFWRLDLWMWVKHERYWAVKFASGGLFPTMDCMKTCGINPHEVHAAWMLIFGEPPPE